MADRLTVAEFGPAGAQLPAGFFDARDGGAGGRLLIIGASVRAAVHSALRCGLSPLGIDLFADRDLALAAPAMKLSGSLYPAGFQDLARRLPASPWMYTGALENHFEVVDRLARERPLWGVSGKALRAVRDPLGVAAALSAAGFPMPGVRNDARGLPRDGSWLAKPRASAGGRGIVPLRSGLPPSRAPRYYQERIRGRPLSALFVGLESGAQLLGVCAQWLGRPGAPFAYRGSIGPWPLPAAVRRQLAALGQRLSWAFELRGLFGVDFVLRSGAAWTIEVNPRYTASVEVLELALRRPLLAEHRRAFDPDAPAPTLPPRRAGGGGVVGKAILFAERPIAFPPNLPWHPPADWFEISRLADLPGPAARFLPGQPVLTLLARAPTATACRRNLRQALTRWQRRLGRMSGR